MQVMQDVPSNTKGHLRYLKVSFNHVKSQLSTPEGPMHFPQLQQCRCLQTPEQALAAASLPQPHSAWRCSWNDFGHVKIGHELWQLLKVRQHFPHLQSTSGLFLLRSMAY